MTVHSRAGWRTLALAGAALLLPGLARAQQTDIEYRDTNLDVTKKLQYNFGFEAQWYEFNNLDFRPLDESSDQAILDSDDRGSFAFTGLNASLGYRIDEHTRFVLGVSERGLWGNDQFGDVNKYLGWVYFTSAYVDLSTKGDNPVRFRVGRQFFTIGGLPAKEFVFLDIVDGVRVDIPLGKVGYIAALPIEVPSLATSNDHANFVSYIGQGQSAPFRFRGDTITRRYGAVLVLDHLVDNLDARAYGFYTDIGAMGSGSDITYHGQLGNFSDNDWTANFGVRASYEAGPITPFATFDVSRGIDRKELVASDVNSNGLAWYLGADLTVGDDSGVRARATYFDSLGPAYLSNGLEYSHGYVGMKAQQVGGTLADRFMGWHPTAYVGGYGVDNTPNNIDRKSGTRAIHGSVGYDLPQVFGFRVGYWFLQDTGITRLDISQLNTIDPPYGYSREEFFAESRLGKVLGQEADLDLDFRVNDHVHIHANGAILLPGAYYKIETGRVAGTALGSPNPVPAWSANAGTQVRF